MFAFSASTFATESFADNGSGNVIDGVNNFFSKVGSGMKSAFGTVKNALGLSASDIAARKQAREERRAQRAAAAAAAAAEDVVMLNAADDASDVFENQVDAILESDEVNDPSAELAAAEKTYRETIKQIVQNKSGKYVNVIKEDMDAAINSARNLINKNPEALKKFRDNATSVSRTNMIDKAITGVSTASMGVGGMQLAQGLGEQAADKDATSQMQGYLSDLYCTYAGNRVAYGATGVRSNGGNELDLMREEFITKAAALKNTKEQLGLNAGIESEVVLDSATTGLYKNDGVNRGSSNFGRLSEALLDETGRDAQLIAAQQKTSQTRVSGGALAVVGGAALAIGGHTALDKLGASDKSDAIKEKYAKLRQSANETTNTLEVLPPQNLAECPVGATGTPPNCVCDNNSIMPSDGSECVRCGSDQTAQNNVCVCNTLGQIVWSDGQCRAAWPVSETSVQEEPTQQIVRDTAAPEKITELEITKIRTPEPTPEIPVVAAPIITNEVVIPETTARLEISNSTSFGHSSYTLVSAAKSQITEFINNNKEILSDAKCIKIVGHADHTGEPKFNNKKLSQQRAGSVAKLFADFRKAIAVGMGSSECKNADGRPLQGRQDSCRKVIIVISDDVC